MNRKSFHMENIKLALIVSFIVCTFISLNHAARANSTPQQDNPDNVKATFILKFPEFVDWPPHSTVLNSPSPFVIGVWGKTRIFSILENATKNIRIKGKKVEVIAISDFSQIKKCNELFIASPARKDINKIMNALGQLPVLTVGDAIDYENREVMINFLILGDRVRFDVNRTVAKKCRIVLKSQIVRQARIRK